MRTTVAYLAAILAALLAAAVPASADGSDTVVSVPLFAGYDLDATSYTYCNSTGEGGYVLAPPKMVKTKVTTSGSSTTVTALVASSDPFLNVAAGDLLYFPRTEAVIPTTTGAWRYVVTRTDANNIVVDAAIDLTSGYAFGFRTRACGTTATSGEVPVSGFSAINFVTQISQISVTGGIDYEVECRAEGPATAWVPIIGPTNKTAVWYGGNVAYEPWAYCRVGFKIGSADDGTDTGTDAEKISAYFIGTRH